MVNTHGLLFVLLQTAIHLSREGVDCAVPTIGNLTGLFGAENCNFIPQSVEDDIISRIKLRFYHGPTNNSFKEVPLNKSTTLLNHPNFNLSSCMVVYIFGWNQKADSDSVGLIIQAYLDLGRYNVIFVDWESVTVNSWYPSSVAVVPSSSKVIARALDDMIDAGAELCHISGLSLGGQAIGLVARNMKHRVRHLIALDPAKPLFYQPIECVPHISSSDADCVEVIHTDGGKNGALVKTGTVDYWMNGGMRPQPGCSIGCSHPRAAFYWIEVLKDPSLFVARRCSSWISFLLNFCSDNDLTIIGQCNKNTIPGNYYLRTTGTSPFGIGLDGSSPAFIIPGV